MKDIKINRFLKKYDEMLPLYDEMIKELQLILENTIDRKKDQVQTIDIRLKTKESIVRKVHEKGMKYERLSDITDIIGIRVATFMEDQVDIVAKKIKNFFILDMRNTIDKRKVLDPRSFGYVSLHYVASFPNEKRYKKFRGIRFEIQIRSLLQHSWATIEHDLGYKSKIGIPDELIRSFSRVASLLELADKEFVSIKKELIKYEEKIHDTIVSGKKMPNDIPFNNITIRYFINNNKVFNSIFLETITTLGIKEEIRRESSSETIKLLDYFKIRKIGMLEEILGKKKNEIIFVTKKIMEETKENTMDKRGIFYSMAYVLLGVEPLSEKLKFLEMFKVLTNDERKKVASQMEKYYLEYKKQEKKPSKYYSLKNIIFRNKKGAK